FEILCDGSLEALHYHRESLSTLHGEYWKAGIGCADYVLHYAFSRLAAFRALQLFTVVLLSVVGLAGIFIAPLAVVCSTVGIMTSASMFTWWRVRHLEALAYPWVTAGLSVLFSAGMVWGLIKRYWFDQYRTSI